MVFKRKKSPAIERRFNWISRSKAVSADRMGYKQFKAWEKASAAECSFIVQCTVSLNPRGERKEEEEKILARVIFHTETSSGHLQRFLSTSASTQYCK